MNYFLDMDYTSTENEESIVTEITNYKIDKTKDFVYFTDITYPITGSKISFSDIVINLEGFEYLSEELNQESDSLYEKIVYEKDTDIEIDEEYKNEEGIYYIQNREYTLIEYDNYIVIIIQDYEYDIINLSTPLSMELYIIDKEENVLLTQEEILDIYEIDTEYVISYTTDVLNTLSYNDSTINVSDTVNNLTYLAYPNKVGSLEILYLVSSTNGMYYDKLVISN